MSWEWPNTDWKGLARFTPATQVELPISRYDQSQDAKGRRKLVDAVYSTLLEKGVRYALEKYNSADPTQLIRTPSEIVGQKEGTCLDLALFFCGVCLGCELLPLVILIEGHALAAVSLNYDIRTKDDLTRSERRYFKDGLLTNTEALRQMVDGGAYLAVECTGFAETEKLPQSLPEGVGRNFKGLLSFERAVDAGSEQLSREDRPFLFALDIAAAHDLGFKPITDADIQAAKVSAETARRKIDVANELELEEVEIGEIVGGKNIDPNTDVSVANKAVIKKSKICSIVGVDNTKKEGR